MDPSIEIWLIVFGVATAASLTAYMKFRADGGLGGPHVLGFLFVSISLLGLAGSFEESLRAQRTDEEISYEGQRVSSVDMVARPSINVDDLRPLLVQRGGEPYSREKIDQTIAALNQTGLFIKVEVEVKTAATGLEVLFVLQPAFYIGKVDFPGALGPFDFSRLIQVVNYPPQEPYDEDRVKGGEAALLQFFISSGYFLVTVRTETQFDQPNRLANLTFHVALGKRAKFGEVKVTGLPSQEAARVENALRSFRARIRSAYMRPGKTYNPDRLKNANDFIRDTLSRMDRLADSVRLEPLQYHTDTNRADITFGVTPGPRLLIEADGAKVSKRTLRRLIPIYEEGTLDGDLVEEGRRNLISYFQSKGYFEARVNSAMTDGTGQERLIYRIDRGDRYRVSDVSIRGNEYFDDEELTPFLSIRRAGLLRRGRFSNDLVKKSTDALSRYYRDSGFADVKVQPEVGTQKPSLYVTFKVTEGPQTVVNNFHVTGNNTQTIGALVPEGLNLGPGKPYSQRLSNQDRDRMVATYLDLGYLDASVEQTVQPLSTDHQVGVAYKIDEGPQTHIASVVVPGEQYTKRWFIDRTAQLEPGRPLSYGKLLEAESRLYETGLFDWASVVPRRPITDQSEEMVLIKLHEAKRNTLTYGFGFEMSARAANLPAGSVALPGSVLVGLPEDFKITQNQFASPRGSIEYSRRNMRGEGETLSISSLIARLDQSLTFKYANPNIRRSIWNSLWSISGERSSENPIYTARVGEASFQVERFIDFKRTKTLLLRYTFNRTALYDLLIPELVLPEDRSMRLSTLSASYVRDTRDKPLDAHHGIYQTLDFGMNPKALGSGVNFVRVLGQTAHFWQFGSSLVWANNVRLGLAKPFAESHVPVSRRFFSGGSTSLRGFPFNGAGPQRAVPICNDPNDPSTCAKITVPVGGNAVFIVNTELRFPIPLKEGLGGVLFYDGGNVYERIGLGHFFNHYTNTIGFGFRYNTPVGPVRFDIGHNLNPVAGIKATQFFVTLGQAF